MKPRARRRCREAPHARQLNGDLVKTHLDSDDASITQRFFRVDPDATSAYDITPLAVQRLDHVVARRRLIRATRREVLQLREALASGWDIGPELAHEERRLAALEMSLAW